MQAKIKGIESQLSEALHASDARSTVGSESGSSGVLSTPKQVDNAAESSGVTRKLEEELSKRDALIEVQYDWLDFFCSQVYCHRMLMNFNKSVVALFLVYHSQQF